MRSLMRRLVRLSVAALLSLALVTVAFGAKSDSSVMVHITRTGHKYHSAGCRYLRKSDIVVTLEQAKARGLTPCSVCDPPQ
jgi:hypothetical protein